MSAFGQVTSSNLKALPTELTARIMDCLDQRDLLNTRQVCRDFCSLANLPKLRLVLDVKTHDGSGSLGVFALRHCMAREKPAPALFIIIAPNGGEYAFCWTSLVMALNCSRLTAVHCESWALSTGQAQYLLMAAPDQLTSLGLMAHASIVDHPSWKRFQHLTRLVHRVSEHDASSPCMPGYGIAGLQSLKRYSFMFHDDEDNRQLFADSFRLPPVETLQLRGNPFSGNDAAVNLAILQNIHLCLPTLKMVKRGSLSFDTEHLYLCAAGRHDMSMAIVGVITDCAKEMHCRQLTLEGFCGCFGQVCDLFEAVLALPSLAVLTLKQWQCHHACMCDQADSDAAPMGFSITFAHYAALLMKVEVQVQGAIRLQLHKMSVVQIVDLECNGHTRMCMCSTCCAET